MKKISLLTFALAALMPALLYAQQQQNFGIYATAPSEALQIGTPNNNGNYKILIPGVYNFEQLKLGQYGNGNAAIEFVNHTSSDNSYGIRLVTNVDQRQGFQIQYAPGKPAYDQLQYVAGFFMGTDGNIGIGTLSPGSYKMAVEGTLGARRVKVTQVAGWPDFVFREDYKLSSLPELENYIRGNRHLPGIPAAQEVEKDGLDLGEMNKLLLQKIEELTLHLINEHKRNDQLQQEVELLKQAMKASGQLK